ncbi:helix-turn-helix transcriptional regulator [Pseudoduganella armeniaca]|uniref:MarR family transcriptional regulator n=1 Tax=Pseudoduganella armeniaca TaxID=2072590 RepID=A0A2R4CD66_9BURK|nr:metalloregulator ArsR/SmtB family transcription factor [Pseudoduganella armeniaca]AVR97408.1 MarR family transcriptional regulator [Pseudoduganella armeniaca]
MNTADQILFLLKTRGPNTAQQLAQILDLTSMGTRRHLEAAQEKGLVSYEDVAEKVGRPSRRWLLTAAGHARFPDRHADLTVQLIDQVKALFGDAAMEQLIVAREAASEAAYRAAVDGQAPLPERVAALAHVRDLEGYMAEVATAPDGTLLLVENHCPICAAARACQQFCRSELEVFQRVLGPDCSVQRTEHQLAGARRCAYRIVAA